MSLYNQKEFLSPADVRNAPFINWSYDNEGKDDAQWIGQKELDDKDGYRLKNLTVKKLDKIDGFWTILHSEMYNIQKAHRTIMNLIEG
ncbi:MAG: hypothetical protein CVV22_08515 [Ignavibacteriae bacterium HGW-Ignavibacteriae-1]|jgi:hypothetical protein|nr:MAG: hypothetical protein CVV22_08515 [Ignavibacteriae bacterium HGW-Ignavibacteriae-1]